MNNKNIQSFNTCFLPYGEPTAGSSRTPIKYTISEQTFVEQRSNWGTNYKFNGKELDDELRSNSEYLMKLEYNNEQTGFYYYGARYYTPDLSIWLSVDPLSDERSWLSPYNYCQWNPVKRIDPDGALDGEFRDRKGNLLGNDGKEDNKIYLLNEGWRARTEDKRINWGGTLSEEHSNQLYSVSTEVSALIIQNRIEEGDGYTISEFYTVGGDKNVEGYMLEPAGPSTTTPNQNKRIPEGVYDIANYSSENYPDNFVLSNKDVPKSRAILYHIGNISRDTKGCNLPGATKSAGRVNGSREKYHELRSFINKHGANNVKTIINYKIPRPLPVEKHKHI